MKRLVTLLVAAALTLAVILMRRSPPAVPPAPHVGTTTVRHDVAHDRSLRLTEMHFTARSLDPLACDAAPAGCGTSPGDAEAEREREESEEGGAARPARVVPAGASSVEQRRPGERPAAAIAASFDGLGFGFTGPQGSRRFTNPSDNALAVGHDHIVQIVNGGMAVFTKRGRLFDSSGRVLYGPVAANAIFTGFGGPCEARNSGDAVVRYDQLADRWLYALPIFQRDTTAAESFTSPSRTGQRGQPGAPGPRGLIDRPAPPPAAPPPGGRATGAPVGGRGNASAPRPVGPYSMCYAVSVGSDPLGPYYRYEFIRPLFPDYPRPAIWPDGYYVPSSTGDDVIQKQACVADRNRMLQGLPATEQCIVIDGVNFLNNADIDGHGMPPIGAPNIMLAAGGSQLRKSFEDDGIYAWQFHVDWESPANTGLSGPVKIAVAPYHYLCDGQLTKCVPQPGDSTRLDAQGDKLMQRVVYRNIGGRESILAEHSVNTAAGGGGVRWYEFRLDAVRNLKLHQQGTYAPDSLYRWLGSMAMDRVGNIGIGYSFGGGSHFPGQRFAARRATDPPGQLTLRETVLVEGEAAQNRATRWEDYTTTAMDPTDDCTFWYVGDYVKSGSTGYSSRIGAFRLPGCLVATVTGAAFYDRNHDGVRQADEPGLPGATITWAGADSGRTRTDANGLFTLQLPADPLYGRLDYHVKATPSPRSGWEATGRIPEAIRGPALRRDGTFSFVLRGQDYLTGIDFGNSCTITSRGGNDALFWGGPGGAALLLAHDAEWRRLVDTVLHLDRGDGSRFVVTGSGREALDQLHSWLADSAGGPSPRLSHQLLVTAFNTRFGGLDGRATAPGVIASRWEPINDLLLEASALVLAGSTNGAERYQALFERLNRNEATVTPFRPDACPRPF